MLIELPCAYGDYLGSDFDAANSRYLTETYEHIVATEGNTSSGVTTYVSVLVGEVVDGVAPTATTEEIVALTGELASLSDYPILNEETLSDYVGALADESWDAYRWDDLQRTLTERFRREYNRAVPDDDFDAFEDMIDDPTDAEYNAIRSAYESEAEYAGEYGTATDVRNERNDESEDAAYREACKLWGARGE
jgi:hypothetical protein